MVNEQHTVHLFYFTEEERQAIRTALIEQQQLVFLTPVDVLKVGERDRMVQQLGFGITKLSTDEERQDMFSSPRRG